MGHGPGLAQPGPHPYPYPYPPAPPRGPLTLGTLSIVFGSVVAAFSLFGAAGGRAGVAGMMNSAHVDQGTMQAYLDAIRTPSLIQSLIFVLMSVWLILLGVGQRRCRAWAARQSVAWGVIGLVVLVGVVALNLVVTGPAAERMMNEMVRHSALPNGLGAIIRWAGIIGIVFYAPYPIILIVSFRKPAIVSAMRT